MLDETDNTTLNSGGNSTSGIPAPRRRRAASRPAGAPAPVETMGTPVAIAAAGSGGSIVTSDVEVSDLPRPPMGRRRKATSTPRDVKTDVPKVVALEPTPEEPESADTRTEEKPRRTRRGASETAPSTEAERGTSQRRRATRRRSSRTAEKVEETTEATTATNKGDGADDDPINVALTEAKARARNHKVEGALANPFGFKEGEERSASDILDSLAVEIGGGEAAMPKRRRRRATRPSEAGSHSAETSGSTDKVAPVEEDKGEVKDRHSSDKKSEKSDYDTTDAVEETAADTEEDGQNRRRRRRGGRRRRRSEDTEDSASEDESSDSDDSQTSSDNDSESSSSDATHRRRRRRRRRGEDISGSDDDPSDVVIKVREPRSRQSVADEVTGIEGSTRVEAKKQRRREGRAAGRRRSAVITDAEFLARRESVDRKMIVRQSDDYSQLAVLEDGVLVEHYVDRASATSSIGNIYLGKVQNVLPSMEAAFIDIGRGRNAVLYAGEVDWAKYGKEGEDKRIEHVLKSGDQVLVQVTKDPVGAKGARLTSHISVPGRFVVYSPGGHLSGISRKLADSERKRLKKIVENNIPSDASV
ncbi:MAG: ribonuclease, partial [Cutibacterium acnes]|nr:ribonuclease [Cutibacterium acnes]